jgi:DNA repair exonuclease SbcCD ATPase subunit
MKRIAARALLAFILSAQVSPATAQVLAQPGLGRETWHEVMLKRLNRSQKNYGEWLEERRQALLAASTQNPFFWYSFWMTVCTAILALALLKRIADSRDAEREHARIEADIRNHDLYSRKKAKEAVERYNQHIEECNRAAEAAESGESPPGCGSSAIESVKAELERVASQLEATTQEQNKLREELREKSLIIADLSTRLDAWSKKVGGAPRAGSGVTEPASAGANGDSARFVAQVNRLQEELYAERQKTKRRKGA